jgi:hypothetical protein
MLDLRLTFDITPAFAKAIGDIADALRGKPMSLHDIDPGFAKASRDITDALRGKLSAPGSAEAVEAGNSTLEDESATQAATPCGGVAFQEPLGIGALAKAAREEIISEIREAVPSLKDEPSPVEVQADTPSEPAEAPKPKRGRPRKADVAQKDTQAAQESAETAEAGNSTPEPESAPQVATSCESAAAPEPQAEAKPEPKAEPVAAPAPAPKPSGDSYGGMPLLQAVQALLDEVAQRGIELADVNARVRRAATERGLPYTSAACLMKAIGYDETRKIVLGE